jgi:hypothetical protein
MHAWATPKEEGRGFISTPNLYLHIISPLMFTFRALTYNTVMMRCLYPIWYYYYNRWNRHWTMHHCHRGYRQWVFWLKVVFDCTV